MEYIAANIERSILYTFFFLTMMDINTMAAKVNKALNIEFSVPLLSSVSGVADAIVSVGSAVSIDVVD